MRDANIMRSMKRNLSSLVILTVGCTFAAALFGFGCEVFAFRSAYEGNSGGTLILVTRLAVYVVLAVTLVLRGQWWGVLAAIAMVVCATALEWALFPAAFQWASIVDPSGYEKEYGAAVSRPDYGRWATFDIIGIGIAAALTQGLRMMAHVDPRRTPDE